jgi:hypothetical protein
LVEPSIKVPYTVLNKYYKDTLKTLIILWAITQIICQEHRPFSLTKTLKYGFPEYKRTLTGEGAGKRFLLFWKFQLKGCEW